MAGPSHLKLKFHLIIECTGGYSALPCVISLPDATLLDQVALSTSVETEGSGYPDVLDVGHLETAVRILAMLARGRCSTFDEQRDLLMQVSSLRRPHPYPVTV